MAELRIRFLDDNGWPPEMEEAEAEAQVHHDFDRIRLHEADHANVEKYAQEQPDA